MCIYIYLWIKYILPKYHYLWQYCPYAKYFMMMWIISLLVWISVKRIASTGGNEGTEIISVNIYHAPPLRLVPMCLKKQQSRARDVSSDSHGNLVWVMNCVKPSHHWMVHSCSFVNLVLDLFGYGAVLRKGNIWMSVCLYSQMLSMQLSRWCTSVCVTSRAVSSSQWELVLKSLTPSTITNKTKSPPWWKPSW